MKNDEIVIELSGGLGNQLFQYATARAYAQFHGRRVSLDISNYDQNYNRNCSILKFLLSSQVSIVRTSKIIRIYRRLIWKLCEIFGFKVNVFSENTNSGKLDLERGYNYLIGYFQDESFFKSIRNEILNELRLPNPVPTEVMHKLLEIEGQTSVCMHIRCGDYLDVFANKQRYGICSKSYYFSAAKFMMEKYPGCKFYIFSDDINLARTFVPDNINSEFVSCGNNEPELDLQMMSACEHFVIANSSFSWWAAWLAADRGKTVIYPNPWYNNKDGIVTIKIPKNWVPVSKGEQV